jgi:hypothetical protein
MKLCSGNILNNDFSIRKSGFSFTIANYSNALVVGFISVGKVEQMICRKVRMERDAHQATLSGRLYVGDNKQRLGLKFARLINAYAACTFRE